MITHPTVTLWADTSTRTTVQDLMPGDNSAADADLLSEASGRSCYQSFHRPNPRTATTADYLAHILDVGHESVLAHGSATFYITGVSRNLTHELIRHRYLAVSELSQRYVAASDFDWVCPPLSLGDGEAQEEMSHQFLVALDRYDYLVGRFEGEHREAYTGTELRKRAREAARGVLPGFTETRIVVTGNHRAWRDFLNQRWSVHADLEIQRLAGLLLAELIKLAPATYADFNLDSPA